MNKSASSCSAYSSIDYSRTVCVLAVGEDFDAQGPVSDTPGTDELVAARAAAQNPAADACAAGEVVASGSASSASHFVALHLLALPGSCFHFSAGACRGRGAKFQILRMGGRDELVEESEDPLLARNRPSSLVALFPS